MSGFRSAVRKAPGGAYKNKDAAIARIPPKSLPQNTEFQI
jgi:hypothetical protein